MWHAEPVTVCAGICRWQDIVWTVFIDADYDGNVTWQEVQNARPALGAAVLGQISLQRGEAPCALSREGFRAGQPQRTEFPVGGDARPNARNAGWRPLGARSS